jgi:hypothetical protein
MRYCVAMRRMRRGALTMGHGLALVRSGAHLRLLCALLHQGRRPPL